MDQIQFRPPFEKIVRIELSWLINLTMGYNLDDPFFLDELEGE
jgi:hypothetical protein